MRVVLEMTGCTNIKEDLIKDLIEDIVLKETGSFIDKKVVVLMYGEKRRTVRGCEYLNVVQSRWDARKQRRKLREETLEFKSQSFNKRM